MSGRSNTCELHREADGRYVGEMRDVWGFVTCYVATLVERDGRRHLALERTLTGIPDAYCLPGDEPEAA